MQETADKNIDISALFEGGVSFLFKKDCTIHTGSIESTATYHSLIQILAGQTEEFTKLEFVLNLLIKTNCKRLTSKIILHIISTSSLFSTLAEEQKFSKLVNLFAYSSLNSDVIENAITFLINIFLRKIMEPKYTAPISVAFEMLAKKSLNPDSTFMQLSEYFIKSDLITSDDQSQETSLFTILRPLYFLCKSNSKYTDFRCTAPTDNVIRLFNIWLYVDWHNVLINYYYLGFQKMRSHIFSR